MLTKICRGYVPLLHLKFLIESLINPVKSLILIDSVSYIGYTEFSRKNHKNDKNIDPGQTKVGKIGIMISKPLLSIGKRINQLLLSKLAYKHQTGAYFVSSEQL